MADKWVGIVGWRAETGFHTGKVVVIDHRGMALAVGAECHNVLLGLELNITFGLPVGR